MHRIIASLAAPAQGPRFMHRHTTLASIAALLLAGCTSLQSSDNRLLGFITPYRVEVVQGNVVTKEQAEAVKPGMNRVQVRDILGSPLLADPFHADRWDYIFTIRRQGAEPQRRSIVALFEGDKLKTLEAPDLPAEREFVASISTAKASGSPRPLELTDEQRKALPPPPQAEAASAPAPTGALREYPPLEKQ
jgi:outer membrane protein assembly factor BamE